MKYIDLINSVTNNNDEKCSINSHSLYEFINWCYHDYTAIKVTWIIGGLHSAELPSADTIHTQVNLEMSPLHYSRHAQPYTFMYTLVYEIHYTHMVFCVSIRRYTMASKYDH